MTSRPSRVGRRSSRQVEEVEDSLARVALSCVAFVRGESALHSTQW